MPTLYMTVHNVTDIPIGLKTTFNDAVLYDRIITNTYANISTEIDIYSDTIHDLGIEMYNKTIDYPSAHLEINNINIDGIPIVLNKTEFLDVNNCNINMFKHIIDDSYYQTYDEFGNIMSEPYTYFMGKNGKLTLLFKTQLYLHILKAL